MSKGTVLATDAWHVIIDFLDIFKCFARISRVSKAMHSMCFAPQLWRCYYFDSNKMELKNEFFDKYDLFKHFHTFVLATETNYMVQSTIDKLMAKFLNLHSYECGANLKQSSYVERIVLLKLTTLKRAISIKVPYLSDQMQKILENPEIASQLKTLHIDQISSYINQYKTADFTNCTSLTDLHMEAVSVSKVNGLKGLQLKRFSVANAQLWHALSLENLASLLNFKKITHLQLPLKLVDTFSASLNKLFVIAPSLASLNVHVTWETPNSDTSIVYEGDQLHTLHVTYDFLSKVRIVSNSMKDLYVAPNCSDPEDVEFHVDCPNLELLNSVKVVRMKKDIVVKCPNSMFEGFRRFTEASVRYKRSSNTFSVKPCQDFTSITAHVNTVREVHVNFRNSFTHANLKFDNALSFYTHQNILNFAPAEEFGKILASIPSKVRSVAFSRWKHVTLAINELPRFYQAKCIDFSKSLITDAHLQQLQQVVANSSTLSTSVQSLTFSNCPDLTEKALIAVLDSFHMIDCFSITENAHITGKLLEYLQNRKFATRNLTVSNCCNLHASDIVNFVNAVPNVRYVCAYNVARESDLLTFLNDDDKKKIKLLVHK